MKTKDSRIIFGQELVFDEGKHLYTWAGKPVPGVTTILKCINKPLILPWAVKETRNFWLQELKSGRTDFDVIHKQSWNAHKNVSKDAADIGKNVHAYAEAHLKGLPKPELLTDPAKRGVEAFHKWLDAHKVEPLASERRLFSQKYYYAGTCDLVAKIDGLLCVGDFKASSGIYPEARMQTAAYQQALEEETTSKFDARWIVRFDKKTGDFEAKKFTDFDLDFTGFNAALALHKTLQTMEKTA